MCIQVNKPERCFNLNVAHFSNLLINWLTNLFVNYTRTNQLRALTTCTLMCGLSWSRLTGLCIADEPVFEIFLHELHLDIQFGQTCHLSTYLHSGESGARGQILQSRPSGSQDLTHLADRGHCSTILTGKDAVVLHNQGFAMSSLCHSGQPQTMKHVGLAPFNKTHKVICTFLHEADNDAIQWLESNVITTLTNCRMQK